MRGNLDQAFLGDFSGLVLETVGKEKFARKKTIDEHVEAYFGIEREGGDVMMLRVMHQTCPWLEQFKAGWL